MVGQKILGFRLGGQRCSLSSLWKRVKEIIVGIVQSERRSQQDERRLENREIGFAGHRWRLENMWDPRNISAREPAGETWAMQAQLWDEAWPEETKRQWVADADLGGAVCRRPKRIARWVGCFDATLQILHLLQ